jgi:AcrB/AcrD/AcrF family/Barrel-sandwich domain of CusB or HlyD membrane-fusion
MWIVRLALRRTYTFIVVAVLIAVLGIVSARRMSTDIFPEIDIPVVSVVWQYTGMPADEVESRIVPINERVLTASVNDIEHVESQSLNGVGVIRVYFHPGAKIAEAEAQVTATCQTLLKIMPPGITPPYIVRYSVTSVPIVQVAVSSDTLTEQQLFDYTSNFIIQRLGTVQGARVPQPWGGKVRQIMVALDLDALYARGLSPQDVSTAIASQNLIIPAGTAKIGDTEYNVRLNSSPDVVAAFNDIPVKTVNGVPVYVKNVAHVRDGYAIQTNIVRRDGRRAVLMTVLKGEGASTLDVIAGPRQALPGIQAQLPPEIKLDFLFDQSVFVRAAVQGVALQSFEKVTAPFAGVVTARNIDPGDLVSADTPNGGREMFHVMRTDVLRVFVNVPQTFSTSLRVGQDAVVYRREDPTRMFRGKVARTANALDPNTRTLLTEVDVPNPHDALRPGMYLQVKFLFMRDVPTTMIPAAAVVTRTGGPMVGVLDDQKAVRYRPVELGRDYGAEIQVVSGLKPGDSVVVRPGDDLPEGTVVRPLPLPAQ